MEDEIEEIEYLHAVEGVKEIRVLFQQDKVCQKIITMDVQVMNNKINKFGIIQTIFATEEVLKDDVGYKVVNDNVQQQIQFFEICDPLCHCQYVVDVQSRKIKPQELNNFSNLLNSEKFSDVTLSVVGRVIHAHKNILANGSPVFDAMFMHKMLESQSSQVEIKDLDYDTVYDFLYYLYAGNLREDSTNDVFAKYSNLLGAANRYCVESLKGQCEEKLVTVLATENALDCLALADLHNATYLKKKVNNFIVENANKIIELPSFKSFLVSHPDLLIEIIRALKSQNS